MNNYSAITGPVRFIVLVMLLVICQPGTALQVTGLYSQRVAVANESDAERDRAFRDALAAVILKVTGERRWIEHPAVQQALNNAQSYVEAIAYSSEPIRLPPTASPGQAQAAGPGPTQEQAQQQQAQQQQDTVAIPGTTEQRYVEVDFAAQLINELLNAANIPVWDSNRPSVLVWMALQDAEGNRSLLTSGINQEIIDSMQGFGESRGLPVIFPVLDFEDRQNLSEDLVWALDEEVIRRASERYNADSVLTGRVHFTSSGELVGLWQFIFGEQAQVFDGFATELEDYLYTPLDRITVQLASYFAIVPEVASIETVRLRVEGVSDLQDYSALIGYVSNLGLVESVSPAAVDGEQLELELSLVGDSRQLFELIALDRDLLPIQSSQSDFGPVLHYRWTR